MSVGIWRDQAACLDWDVNLFYSENKVDQRFAQSICKACPVRQACERDSDDDDFKYGVRAGHLPGTYRPGRKREPFITDRLINRMRMDPARRATAVAQEVISKRRAEERRNTDWSYLYGTDCKNGHPQTELTVNPYGQCRTCNSVYHKSRSTT